MRNGDKVRVEGDDAKLWEVDTRVEEVIRCKSDLEVYQYACYTAIY